MQLRTPLSRVLGLGSAKDGTSHWWAQRMTAMALVPLLLWFGAVLVTRPDYSFQTLTAFIQSPLNAVLMVLLAGTLMLHAKLGLQVVVEDYMRGATKTVAIILINFSAVALGVAAVFAVLRISLSAT